MAFLPRTRTAADVRRWMREVVFAEQNVWVAEVDRRILGYASLADEMLSNLYVHPEHQRRGIGSALLARVKAYAPHGFTLWTFEPNQDAIRFYQRHGFRTLTTTDGAANEERVPDRLMGWPGRHENGE